MRFLWIFAFIFAVSSAQTQSRSQIFDYIGLNASWNGSNWVNYATGYSNMFTTDTSTGDFTLYTGGNAASAGLTRTMAPAMTVTAAGTVSATSFVGYTGSFGNVNATGTVTATTLSGNGSAITNVGAPALIVEDQKASGTSSGALTAATWNSRTLNTVVRNVISGVSLDSNKVTLPAGTYYARWSAPAYRVDAHQTRLFNITASATIAAGDIAYATAAQYGGSTSVGGAVFTLSSTSLIELQHYINLASGGASCGGMNISSNVTEVYSRLEIWQL